ncbi:MAG: IS3 family transposase [Thermomicrobiales bacterium]|nr:IS3 family transposase [Thermomicrobiales bacterium]MCO5219199.1 IS3 family transposase [Thermomicrobiales bacterium]MCO5225082.1 IS3 family transposase [Thermomicrobiales bacterium]
MTVTTQAISALKVDYPVHILLAAANLPSTTYYDAVARQQRPDPDAELKRVIGDIATEVRGIYGYRRMQGELGRRGIVVGEKKVLKQMQALGLTAVIRRKRYSSHKGEVGVVAQNVLNRQVTTTAPNQKWVTDISQFRVQGKTVYLSAVMDLYDRQIIGYTVGQRPTVVFANASLKHALATVDRHAGLLIHSDQGFHYQHRSWQHLVQTAGATQSMSRKGNCYDNAVMESFFGHLKEEMFNHTSYPHVEALTEALHWYIRWYNTERISTRLGKLSPVQYRARMMATQDDPRKESTFVSGFPGAVHGQIDPYVRI